MSPSCRAFCRSCTSALNSFVTHGLSLECLTAVVVGKCSSIRELSTDMKASNCSWHVGRRYSEDQLMAVRSATNGRLVSVVTCRAVLIVFDFNVCRFLWIVEGGESISDVSFAIRSPESNMAALPGGEPLQ